MKNDAAGSGIGGRSGFTLIELLVVIAIIGVIAAILFPVFVGVRERGRRTACLSNERQLGIAMMQYVADSGEQFPFGNAAVIGPGVGWAGDILPYLKTTQLFQCPDDATHTDSAFRNPSPFVVSYGFNCNLGGVRLSSPRLGSLNVPAATTGTLAAPSKTVLLFEISDNITQMVWTTPTMSGPTSDFGSPSGNTATHPGIPATGDTTFLLGDGGQFHVGDDGIVTRYATGDIGGRVLNGGAGSIPRHGGGANYLACDGHVVWLRPSRVSGGQSQPIGGGNCGQDDTAPACGGKNTAAGTASGKYALTFSVK